MKSDSAGVPLSGKPDQLDVTSGFEGTTTYAVRGPSVGVLIAGRFSLEEKLGEGGMGEVWVARQLEPVKRKVALKVIKAGMDSKSVVQRFEQERQALALMDHPNIAKVLDGGLTDDRRPFFVMELVNGSPLTKFCDDAKLGIRERLELFIPICQAVQHAHQKGIVHRDLKPGNILVTLVDGKAVPKVIDFGVAKATSGRLIDDSLSTQLGTAIGTLEYMSPEQAGYSSEDVDTRADIYSLGVILYELLTGLRPFDSKRLKRAALDEMIRIIREEEPSKPSTRLSTAEGLPSLAAVRHIEPSKLAAMLRGELDSVVMKCLEKQRERRYETANGLARDIQRYLADEVVEAKPPSAGYRIRKFVRRHKGQVAAAAVILLTLIGGVLGTTWGLFEARHQRDEAEISRSKEAEQRKQAEEQRDRATAAEKLAKTERDRANQEAARATAINSFVEQMFLSVDPEEKGSREVTVLELVNKASEKADKTLKDQPQVEAAVRTLLGRTLNSLGKNKESIPLLQKALASRESGIDKNTYPHFETLQALGMAFFTKGEYRESIKCHQQALDILTALGEKQLQEMAAQHRHLARANIKSSRFPEAEKHLQKCDEIFQRMPQVLLSDRGNLAGVKSLLASTWKGDLEASEKHLTDALAYCRADSDEPGVADNLNSLAVVKLQRTKYDEAIPLFEEAIEISRRLHGDVHPDLAIKLENLGNVWFRKKNYAKTTELLNQVAVMREKLFGPDSFPVARTRFNLAMVLNRQGHPEKAVETINKVLPVFRKHVGDKSTEVATLLQNRGACRKELKEYEAAIKDYEGALEIVDSFKQPTGALRLKILFDLTQLYRLQGNKQRADETMKLAIGVLDPKKPDHQALIKKFEELPASGVVEEKKP